MLLILDANHGPNLPLDFLSEDFFFFTPSEDWIAQSRSIRKCYMWNITHTYIEKKKENIKNPLIINEKGKTWFDDLHLAPHCC